MSLLLLSLDRRARAVDSASGVPQSATRLPTCCTAGRAALSARLVTTNTRTCIIRWNSVHRSFLALPGHRVRFLGSLLFERDGVNHCDTNLVGCLTLHCLELFSPAVALGQRGTQQAVDSEFQTALCTRHPTQHGLRNEYLGFRDSHSCLRQSQACHRHGEHVFSCSYTPSMTQPEENWGLSVPSAPPHLEWRRPRSTRLCCPQPPLVPLVLVRVSAHRPMTLQLQCKDQVC